MAKKILNLESHFIITLKFRDIMTSNKLFVAMLVVWMVKPQDIHIIDIFHKLISQIGFKVIECETSEQAVPQRLFHQCHHM